MAATLKYAPVERVTLKRFYGRKDLHFVTFSCYQRRPLLSAPADRDEFVRVLDRVRNAYVFLLIGYVVMPEHVHLLISEPAKGTPSAALQAIKQIFSRTMHKRQTVRPPRGAFPKHHKGQRFWQARFYDFNVWSEKKIREKLDYMHANPVKRGLVTHPGDWRWSSWAFVEKGKQGLIRIDVL